MENQEKKPESTQIPEVDVGGRPSKYLPKYNNQTYKLCLLGATDKQLADFFEVDISTITEWKLKYPGFSASIKRGKEKADAEIAKSLFHRAKGYSHREDDIKAVAKGNGEGSEIVITPTIKHYPPDTMACIYWLNNRRKKEGDWRHRVDHTTDGKEITAPPTFQIIDTKTKEMCERLVAGGGRESQKPEEAVSISNES